MKYFLVLLILFTFSVFLFAQTEGVEPKVTFIELGSVNCIPCKQM